MSDCKAFLDFCIENNDIVIKFLDELSDMKNTDTIRILDVYRHNACNHTISGTVILNDIEYGFVIESGDWNGTVVREWGLSEDVDGFVPPEPITYTFIPVNDRLKDESPGMWTVYLCWKKEEWFKEKVSAYNYDNHFSPGIKTENYYRDWASKKGLKIATNEYAEEIINRPKKLSFNR